MSKETRYLKIELCSQCPFTGHSRSAHNSTITFFCCNPRNRDVDIPKEKVGDIYYPMTWITEDINENPIPKWCKLPSKVGD